MWYEENDQFVRAPTPQAYDNLVNELQDRDSVVFESISLPKTRISTQDSKISLRSFVEDDSSPRRMTSKHFHQITDDDCIPISESKMKLSIKYSPKRRQNNSISSFCIDEIDEETEFDEQCNSDLISELQKKIDELERENIEYEKEVNENNDRISELEQELRISNRKNESLEKYKALYESTLNELIALKEALNKEGKVRRVKLCSAKRIRKPVAK